MKKRVKSFLFSFCIMVLFPSLVFAYYIDKEKSIGNSFRAATLNSDITNQSSSTLELVRGGTASLTFNLKNIGELKTSNTQIISGISNSKLMNVIDITVQIDGGAQMAVNDFFLNQIHGDTNVIKYNFYISDTNYDNNLASSVDFKITNKSWQTGLPTDTGFTDRESIFVTLQNSTQPLLQLMMPLETIQPVDILEELTNPIIE